jgi:hypothetical protein
MKRIAVPLAIGGGLVAVSLGALLIAGSGKSHRYKVSEGSVGTDVASADAGPVRMARISNVSGDVAYRADAKSQWTKAGVNLPVRQGAQVWVKRGSRAELQFDDGSAMRMGGGALASMRRMYSDRHGEYTHVELQSGIATLRTRNRYSQYVVDTPRTSIEEFGPGDVRIGVADNQDVEVACREGETILQGDPGERTLRPNDCAYINDGSQGYYVEHAALQPDPFDQYCAQREVIDTCDPHLPQNIALVAGDLRQYGSWRDDPQYGQVWRPRVASNWRPYSSGHWAFVNPVGWTWCDDNAWGYAPSHYGTWMHEADGWAWCPGPARQYWSPANVQFSDAGDRMAWCPLAPRDVRYPSLLSVSFGNSDFALNFSIGGVACYRPVSNAYCEPRPWDNRYVNRYDSGYGNTNITNITNIYNNYGNDNRFVSRNAGYGCASVATRREFLDGGRFREGTGQIGGIFARGRGFAETRQGRQLFGPASISPLIARGVAYRGPADLLLTRGVHRGFEPSVVAATMNPSEISSRQVSRTDVRGYGRGIARSLYGNQAPLANNLLNRQNALIYRNQGRALAVQPGPAGLQSVTGVGVRQNFLARSMRNQTGSAAIPGAGMARNETRRATIPAATRLGLQANVLARSATIRDGVGGATFPLATRVGTRTDMRSIGTRNDFRGAMSAATRVDTRANAVARRLDRGSAVMPAASRVARRMPDASIQARTMQSRVIARTGLQRNNARTIARMPALDYARSRPTVAARQDRSANAPISNARRFRPAQSYTMSTPSPRQVYRLNQSYRRPEPTVRETQPVVQPRARMVPSYSRPEPAVRYRDEQQIRSYQRPAPVRQYQQPAPYQRAYVQPRPAPQVYQRPERVYAQPRPAPQMYQRPERVYAQPRPAPQAYQRPERVYAQPRPAPQMYQRPERVYAQPRPAPQQERRVAPAPQALQRGDRRRPDRP